YYLAKERKTLQEKLIPREKQFFYENFESKKVPMTDTMVWLKCARKIIGKAAYSAIKKEDRVYFIYSHAIVYLALGIDNEVKKVPETLVFDHFRLANMRTESQDISITACVLAAARQVAKGI